MRSITHRDVLTLVFPPPPCRIRTQANDQVEKKQQKHIDNGAMSTTGILLDDLLRGMKEARVELAEEQVSGL